MIEKTTYAISLRITHPDMDASLFEGELGLAPEIFYTAGDPKLAGNGREIGGVRKESFWCHAYSIEDGDELEASLDKLVMGLERKKDFLRRIAASGGRAEFFIGWFSSTNSGFVLKSRTLRHLADLDLDLSFDIYPS
ncbi:DUF4279 domain-containing protein [Stenotrophomonas maltophilia]|uniref:DUF4279 domain-containing protein n=1 Tax=Stenotrophomonas maltophilia TaxID=40324 RepID=UPI0015DCD7DC|nr:DUF4279 domain-containing protein [Stenotrophomonas maltophilia]QDL29874.1 DUF4279 domain-containing protein [Stenotrophomonas maltophilia]